MSDQKFVLDTFAVMTYLGHEAGSDAVEDILQRAKLGKSEPEAVSLFMNYINLGEVYYMVKREEGEEKAREALAMIKNWNIEFIGVDERLALDAGGVKSSFPISYADCFAFATAQLLDAKLVTGDPEFRKLEHVGDIVWI